MTAPASASASTSALASLKRFIAAHFLPLGCLASLPLLGIAYIMLNSEGRHAYSLVTDLDRELPFLNIFVVPYLGWFAFILAMFVYLAVKDRAVFWKTLLRFHIGLIVCYAVYAVFQTYVPRPEIAGAGLLDRMVEAVYRFDRPFNCFPSTHVLTSYLMFKAIRSSSAAGRTLRISTAIMAMSIIASTLFIKQHVLMDAAGAIILAELVWGVSERAAAMARRMRVSRNPGRKAGSKQGHSAVQARSVVQGRSVMLVRSVTEGRFATHGPPGDPEAAAAGNRN